MMQKIIASQQLRGMMQINKRMFGASLYNYTDNTNPRVWMNVSKNGVSAGKLEFELFQNHSPALSYNFAALCNNSARSLVGTSFVKGMPGFGVHTGKIEGDCDNTGFDNARLADENLEMRHYKRGMLTMMNNGQHDNGS